MIDISVSQLAQISCRNSIGQILYVCEHMGEEGLPDLFRGILDTKTLISTNYQYLGKPLTLGYFKDVSNWYSNDINLTLFDNLTAMGIDAYNTGHYIITSAKKTHNIATIAYLQMLGTRGTISKVNQINQLYNRTKKVEIEFKADNLVCSKIFYENGCPHNKQVTRQNIGAYVAILESTGLQQVRYSVEEDDFSQNNYTVISYAWQQTTRFSQFRWLMSKLIARLFCKGYMASEDVIRSYHQNFVTSLDLEVAEKEKQRLKSETYYQQLIEHKEQKESELTLLVKEKTIKLEQSIQDKERLFENFSHELKTPLTLIIGPIEQLLKQKFSPEVLQQLTGVNQNAHRLFDLVQMLLSHAEVKIQRNKLVATNILSCSQYILSSLQPLAIQKNATLRLDYQADEGMTLLLQVQTWELLLTNLLTNAIKHGQEKNQIIVTIKENSQNVILAVSDNNPAISETQQQKIFTRFTTHATDGHGIGLAIVEELANNHHATIEILANEQGNKFIICFPITLKTSVVKNLPVHQLPFSIAPMPEESLPSILLVEDNIELAQFLVSSFSTYFTVTHCVNGRDALLSLEKDLVDLIISDVMMPVMDGYEFCQQVKNDEALSHIPLLLLTAKSDLTSQRKGLALKADDYIGKPFNTDILIQKIQNMINTYQAHAKSIKQQLLNVKSPNITQTPVIAKPDKEEQLLQQLHSYLQRNYHDAEIKTGDIAQALHQSERNLNRKLKTLAGASLNELLREFRLEQAKQLLENGNKVKEVCFDCGFSSLAYFSRCFTHKFGQPPSRVVREVNA